MFEENKIKSKIRSKLIMHAVILVILGQISFFTNILETLIILHTQIKTSVKYLYAIRYGQMNSKV